MLFWEIYLSISIAFAAGVGVSLTNKYIINNEALCRCRENLRKKSCCFSSKATEPPNPPEPSEPIQIAQPPRLLRGSVLEL